MASPTINSLLCEQISELTMSPDNCAGSSESNESRVDDINDDDIQMHQILIDEEKNLRVFVDLMDYQPSIDWTSRASVLEFVLALARHFNLSTGTFYLAVDILDRYAGICAISAHYYLLFGVVSLWISAKSNETQSMVPRSQLLVDHCFNLYNKADIKRAELEILERLNWDISTPTLEFFVRLSLDYHIRLETSEEDIMDAQLERYYDLSYNFALYLCEMMMFREEYYCFSTATIGICGYYLANHLLQFDLMNTLPAMGTKNANDCLQLMNLFAHYPIECVKAKYYTSQYCHAAGALDEFLEMEDAYKTEIKLRQKLEETHTYLDSLYNYFSAHHEIIFSEEDQSSPVSSFSSARVYGVGPTLDGNKENLDPNRNTTISSVPSATGDGYYSNPEIIDRRKLRDTAQPTVMGRISSTTTPPNLLDQSQVNPRAHHS